MVHLFDRYREAHTHNVIETLPFTFIKEMLEYEKIEYVDVDKTINIGIKMLPYKVINIMNEDLLNYFLTLNYRLIQTTNSHFILKFESELSF